MMKFTALVFFVAGSFFTGVNANVTICMNLPAPVDFFHEVNYDLTSLTWNHGIKEEIDLETALQKLEPMLVVEIFPSSLCSIPVIGDPSSKLTFENFFNRLMEFNELNSNSSLRKGLKVIFPEKKPIESVLIFLNKISDNINFPLILHGDILQGPSGNNSLISYKPLKPLWFVNLTETWMPKATLSLGWTTEDINWKTEYDPVTKNEPRKYTSQNIAEMHNVIDNSGLDLISKELTISIRLPFAKKQEVEFAKFLRKIGLKTILTLTAKPDDWLLPEPSRAFVTLFGKSRLYVDLEQGSWFRSSGMGLVTYIPNPVQSYFSPMNPHAGKNGRSITHSNDLPKQSNLAGGFLFFMIIFAICMLCCFAGGRRGSVL